MIVRKNNKFGILNNVYFCPQLNENLFSIRRIVKSMNVTFTKQNIIMRDVETNKITKVGHFDKNIWTLEFEVPDFGKNQVERENFLKRLNNQINSRKRKVANLMVEELKDEETGGSPPKSPQIDFNDREIGGSTNDAESRTSGNDFDEITLEAEKHGNEY